MRSNPDELMAGAIDLHCHAVPEYNPAAVRRLTNEQIIRQMVEAGMGGVVLKSHLWPTVLMGQPLAAQFPGFCIIGSVTLNASAGGIAAWAVEAAARLGAKVVWLPTWSAHNDIAHNAASKGLEPYLPSVKKFNDGGGYVMTQADGTVSDDMRDVLEACKQQDVVLCTGHISKEESLAVAEAAREMGFAKLIFTHPDAPLVGADLAFMQRMAELGAYIELSAAGLTPVLNRVTPQYFGQIVQTVGAERCVLSTDYFHEWSPTAVEQYRLLVSCLSVAGVADAYIRTMGVTTPAWLLGL